MTNNNNEAEDEAGNKAEDDKAAADKLKLEKQEARKKFIEDLKKTLNKFVIGSSVQGYALRAFFFLVFITFIWLMVSAKATLKERFERSPQATLTITQEESPEIAQEVDTLIEEQDKDKVIGREVLSDLGNFDEATYLAVAPLSKISELTTEGILPKIAETGERPLDLYARPSRIPPKVPKITIILTEMGMNKKANHVAIKELPGTITIAFNPYTPDLDNWARLARQDGHEFLLELPTEPYRFPKDDQGPYAISTQATPEDNLKSLTWMMLQTSGYIGFINLTRSRVSGIESTFDTVLNEMSKRGLIFIDQQVTDRSIVPLIVEKNQMPFLAITHKIDAIESKDSIEAALKLIEDSALSEGHAIAVASCLPATIEILKKWIETLPQKGIALVPASAYYKNLSYQQPAASEANSSNAPQQPHL